MSSDMKILSQSHYVSRCISAPYCCRYLWLEVQTVRIQKRIVCIVIAQGGGTTKLGGGAQFSIGSSGHRAG